MRTWTLLARGYAKSTSGAASVEFVVWLALLAPLFLSAVDIGTYIYQRMEVSNVAQSAVQSAWAHCDHPPTSTCSNFETYLSRAIASGSQLGAAVTETSGQRAEGYYCVDGSTGQLVSNGTNLTCPNTAKAGYYFKLQVSYPYSPIFTGISVASRLGTPISQTAWTRLK